MCFTTPTLHQTSLCDILLSQTQMTTKQRYELSWHPGSALRGQLLDGKNHRTKWEEPPAFIRALKDTRRNKRIRESSPTDWLRKDSHHSCIILELPKMNLLSLRMASFWEDAHMKSLHGEMKTQERDRPATSFLCLRFDNTPDTNYKPRFHRRRHRARLYVIIVVEAQDEGLELSQTEHGSVWCCTTAPPEFLDRIIVMSAESESFSGRPSCAATTRGRPNQKGAALINIRRKMILSRQRAALSDRSLSRERTHMNN